MLLVAAVSAEAKYWKVGPSSVAGMDFASINAAMESESVAAGDTLYLDQYYNESAAQTISKQVVIIGTGYDTSLNDEQVVARLTSTLMLKAANAVVKSLRVDGTIQFWAANCTVERCYMTGVKVASAIDAINHIYSCYIKGSVQGYGESSYSKLDIQNCVILSQVFYLTSSTLNNNIIYWEDTSTSYTMYNIDNSTITNNYIWGRYYNSGYYTTDVYDRDLNDNVINSGSGNTIEHNLLSRSALNYFPNNVLNCKSPSSYFVCSGTYSDYYQLNKETGDNPALNYATDGGEIGCHGGMFGCPSGGRPQYIPYFKKVTVGSRTEDGKLPVTLKIAIQSE